MRQRDEGEGRGPDGDKEHSLGGHSRPGDDLGKRNPGLGCYANGYEVKTIEVHGMTWMGGVGTMG
jgi:hypothetical protein